jgi:hypothetical protein
MDFKRIVPHLPGNFAGEKLENSFSRVLTI